MTGVNGLGYLGFEVSDRQSWRSFLEKVFGVVRRADGPESTDLYRLDEYHHRLAIRAGATDRLDFVGWEATSPEDFRCIAGRVRDSGISIQTGDTDLCRHRAVRELIRFEGPDGVSTEVYWGPFWDSEPLVRSCGNSGFNTGALGLGHVVLAAADRDTTAQWYLDVLGFKVTDYIVWEDLDAVFLRCNPRHHSLAVTNLVMDMKPGDLSHFMLEARSLVDVGRAYDALVAEGFHLGLTLGQHSNDKTVSFYVYSPSGWLVEYGFGGLTVDDSTWAPKQYDSTKLWGHEFREPPVGQAKRL
jgi:2,3-dihydroxybiphenyl 1,2-dioxygenase